MSLDFYTGISLGIIMMNIIYNISLYYYNREKVFILYSLAQIFIVSVIFIRFQFNVDIQFNIDIQSPMRKLYEVVSLLGGVFSLLFCLELLEAKRYVPRLYSIAKIVLLLDFIDLVMVALYHSLLLPYHIFPFFGILLIAIGIVRTFQGSRPALFYLLGWASLILSIFILDHYVKELGFNPLLVGSPIEAILFTLAISYKVKIFNREKMIQDLLMKQQAKMASLGELLGNIMHQWMQPLTSMSYVFINIGEAKKYGSLTDQYLDKKIKEGQTYLSYMSETLENFKSFYLPQREKEKFLISTAIQHSLELMRFSFMKSAIDIKLEVLKDRHIYSYKNELMQILIIILTNAIDAFNANTKKELSKITIIVDEDFIVVQNNASKIEENILKNIFNPNFTTKEDGMGIGLYIAKKLIENSLQGSIEGYNIENGVAFKITIP